MRRITHHYAVIGDSPADLLSPALDARFERGTLCLVAPAAQIVRADAVASAAQERGWRAKVFPVSGPRDTAKLRVEFANFAAGHGPATAALNVSGVDPLYAIPARDAFQAHGHPVYAVEPDSDWLIWLSTGSGDYAAFNVADSLSLSEFLRTHGIELVAAKQTWRRQNYHWNQVALEIARRAPDMREAVAELNRLGLSCSPRAGFITKPIEYGPNRSQIEELLDIVVSAGMAELEGQCVRFRGQAEVDFARGGWLEFRVFYAARPLVKSGRIQELACGVNVSGPGPIANEWDVAFLANNNLHIIECKAKRAGNDGPDTLYKLESLARTAGMNAFPMLCRLAPPTPTEAARAKRLGIEIVLPARGNLTSHIEAWLDAVAERS